MFKIYLIKKVIIIPFGVINQIIQGLWNIYQKATEKVDVYNNEISDIIRIQGEGNIGTGKQSSNGMGYNKMKEKLPRTIYFIYKIKIILF